MSRHDPNNANCDKNAYPGADGVLCTCDVDPANDRPAPSIVMPPDPMLAHPVLGTVTLSGSKAAAYLEAELATREFNTWRESGKPIEARWRAALDRLHAEMLR